ncbi:MAG: GntR family transcriptional regulator [Firmicutes bacterium]|jgi:GntR family transcriptional regulator|nr:GntR family transcriptional regulator [Bacillota bacterium]
MDQSLDRRDSKPLYEQIMEHIRVMAQTLKPHEAIPSEPELASRYQVSRGTVKQALDELVHEGVLYRVPKRGTFVAPPRILRSFTRLPSHSEDIRARGLTPSADVVHFGVERADTKVARYLNVSHGAPVWRIERVRRANGEPVLLSTSYVPKALVPELTREDVEQSLYEALARRYDMRPVWAHDVYTAVNAHSYEASLLGVPLGAALLLNERLSYLADDRRIEYALSYIRGDQYEIHIDINRPQNKSGSLPDEPDERGSP